MTETSSSSARPLSPHLTIYRLTPTMAMSIIHRITGAGLYFGTLLIALWLIAAAGDGQFFATVNGWYGSWLGRLILFGYTWALIHHALGGLRHLVWDTGAGLAKETATRMAWLSVAGSVTLTIVIWIIGYFVR